MASFWNNLRRKILVDLLSTFHETDRVHGLVYYEKLQEFLRKHSCHSLKTRFEMYGYLLNTYHLETPFMYLEFGVYEGESLYWWLEHNLNPKSVFVGFDSFTGLPESFGEKPAGTFDTAGQPPKVADPRCRFHIGWFNETLPGFLGDFRRCGRLVVHLDADLYSSTLYVLCQIEPFLQKGDLIIFDEFATPVHEFRAFLDFTSAFRNDVKLVSATEDYWQAAFLWNARKGVQLTPRDPRKLEVGDLVS